MTKVVQMRQRGSVTIPTEYRKRYKLSAGDPLTLVDLGEGLFLSPKYSILPKLVSEIEDLRKKYNVSLEELILGVADERAKYTTLKNEDE